MKFEINNLFDLEKFSKVLAKNIEQEDTFSLIGDLGAGKTTLVQFLGKELGVEEFITSPTYSIVNIYDGNLPIYHLDLYRLEDPSELESLDYEEYFYPNGVSFIEWAEKGEGYLPEDLIEINIDKMGEKRIISFTSDNKRTKEIKEGMNEYFSS